MDGIRQQTYYFPLKEQNTQTRDLLTHRGITDILLTRSSFSTENLPRHYAMSKIQYSVDAAIFPYSPQMEKERK
jgi:hypothetical protein